MNPKQYFLFFFAICLVLSCRKNNTDVNNEFKATIIGKDPGCAVWLAELEGNRENLEAILGTYHENKFGVVNLHDTLKVPELQLLVKIRQPADEEKSFACNTMGIPPVFVYFLSAKKQQ